MKIAHLTLMFGCNYGGSMQALATQRLLKEFGHEVVTVNYHPSKRVGLYRGLFGQSKITQKLEKYIFDYKLYRGSQKFIEFRESNFLLSRPIVTQKQIEKFCSEFDAVAVGSDQIWAERWIRPFYFLDFELPKHVKKIALAACCGTLSGSLEYRKYLGKCLSGFDAISVRNSFTANLVNEFSEKKCVETCDPTLVVQNYDDDSIVSSQNYALIYSSNRTKLSVENTFSVIRELKKRNLKILSIVPPEMKSDEYFPADEEIYDISPPQWNSLIRHAKILVTDSFHGAVFSTIHNIPLIAISTGHVSFVRVTKYLQDLGLERLLLEEPSLISDVMQALDEIDWNFSNNRKHEMASNYRQFLESI